MMCLMGTLTVSSRDKEDFPSVAITISAGDLPEHLYLTGGQIFIARVLRQVRRHRGWDAFFPCADLADHVHQFTRRHVLEEVGFAPR
jgi:hypothetical protein